MFSNIIDFKHFLNENEKIEFLYDIFKNDFVDNRCCLADKIYIDPKSHEKKNNKEEIFWHIITKKQRGRRVLDLARASRIKWIKPIIKNYSTLEIKRFYYFEDNNKIRLYLWAYKHDFVVILQKLGSSSSYLVTSFYIDNQKKRDKFHKKFEDYINKVDPKLKNCEWF